MDRTMSGTRELVYSAVLVALALALSWTERFLPLQLAIPLPGVKLGLANIVTMMALYFWGARTAFAVVGVRCFLGSFFGGGLSALAFSLGGGLLALQAMSLAKKLPGLSVYGVSVLGAAAHHLGQILAAMAVMGSVYVLGYLPYLLGASILTGMATGSLCSGIFRRLAGTAGLDEGRRRREKKGRGDRT